MDGKKREKLEGLLRAVQDIKSDYYVGTQEAYRAIKRISFEIYENPERTAIMVNHALKQRFTRPSYEATPERIYGTFGVLSDGCFYTDELYQDELEYTSFLYTLDYHEMIKNIGHLLEIEENIGFQMQPSDLRRIITPYFINANEKNVSNDEEFSRTTIDYLRKGFREYSNNISPQLIPDCIKWAVRFLNNLRKIDWNREFSKERFNRNLSFHRAHILVDELSLSNIVDRLINDRYDHRLEYRRQVLSHWLKDRDSYERTVKNVEFMIKSREERCKKFISLNAPSNIIQNERKMIQSAKFIRHVLGSEKNFVKKCLGEKDGR